MFSILKAALSDIAARRMDVAKLMFLPMLANVLAEMNLTRVYIATDYVGGTGAGFLAFFVSIATVAFVAVGWHRIVLLGEKAKIVAAPRGAIYLHYAVSWFFIGFVPILGVLLLGVGVYVIAVLFGLDAALLDGYYMYVPEFAQGVGSMFYTGMGMFVVAMAVIWYLFRVGVVLPHLALGHNHIGMRRAWGLTRPQAGPIFGTALVASALQSLATVLLFVSTSWAIDYETGEAAILSEYVTTVLNVMVFTFSGLIGAAILTTIYKRIEPSELPRS